MPVREWVSTTVVPASKATVMYMFLLLLSFRKRKAIPEMKGRRAHKKNASQTFRLFQSAMSSGI